MSVNKIEFSDRADHFPFWSRIHGMNSSTSDKIEGTAKEVTGTIKEKTGEVTGNPDLQDRGTAEKIAGKVQDKVGDIKKVFEQ